MTRTDDNPQSWPFTLSELKQLVLKSVAMMGLGLFFLGVLLLGSSPVLAQEAISGEEPTPSSVDGIVTPMERSFEEKKPQPGLFPSLKERMKDTPPFIRDTKFDINIRTFYFDRNKFDNTISEAWTLGGALTYRSGWLLDHFGIGAVLYTSQPLYAPEDRDGTLLLQPGQERYTALGQIYGRVKLLGENFINLYRYEYNTPYLNKNDTRMTPNTFEGYTFTGSYGGKDSAPGFRYGLGYIDKIKPRNSDTFISMSEAAGVKDADRGVITGGANVSYKGLSFGAINYYSSDIINIFYTEASYKASITDRLEILVSAQFTDQRSVGDNLLKGFSFSTNQFGVKSDISYGGAILTLGYSVDAQGADLQNPWSSFPGYTSVQVQDFNRAGENAFVAKLSYDFTRLGLEGLTTYALYVHGWNRINPSGGSAVPNENEFDADLQWRPRWKFLKGLWFRARYADVHQYEGPGSTINDFRIIVNYDFSLF